MSKATKARFEELLKTDKAFARWMRKFANEKTRSDYFQWLTPFMDSLSESYDKSPMSYDKFLAKYKQEGDVRDELVDEFEAKLNEVKKVHMGLAKGVHAATISFLKHNGAIFGAAAFEIPAPVSEEIGPEYNPNAEEFEVLLRFAQKPRDKFMIVFFGYAFPRVGAIIDPVPMTLRHVLDLDLEALGKGEVRFKHQTSCAVLIYAAFRNGGDIIRTSETYVTFMLPRAMQYLKEYLEWRIRKGENLTADGYLFKTESRSAPNAYLDESVACTISRRINKAAGFVKTGKDKEGKDVEKAKFTIHSLRRFGYNSLSGIDDVDKEALMGHVKGVRARYHGTVDELLRAVEFMRPKYEQGMKVAAGMTKEEMAMENLVNTVKSMGITDERIEQIKRIVGRPMTLDALTRELRKDFERLAPHATDGGTRYLSKIVTREELLPLINAGWEIVKELSDGSCVLRLDMATKTV